MLAGLLLLGSAVLANGSVAVAAQATHATLYFNTFCSSCKEEIPLARRWISQHPAIATSAVAFRTSTDLGREEGRRYGLRVPIVGDPDGTRARRDGVERPTVILLRRGGRELRRIRFSVAAPSTAASAAARSRRTRVGGRRLCAPGRRPDRSLGMLRCVPIRPVCRGQTVLKRRSGGGGWVCMRPRVRRPVVREPEPPPPPKQPILENVRRITSLDIPEIRQGAVHLQAFSAWCPGCRGDERYFQLQGWQDGTSTAREVALTCADDRQDASDFARERGWRFPVLVLGGDVSCTDLYDGMLNERYWGADGFFVDGVRVEGQGDCRFLDHPMGYWYGDDRLRCLPEPPVEPPSPTEPSG